MIMTGSPCTRARPIGIATFRITFFTIVLAISLCACSNKWFVGEGRGDWTNPICNGYAIFRVNSKEIVFIFQDHPNDSGGSIILPNFFVEEYQVQEPYICLKGIHTRELTISEAELSATVFSYYFIDTLTGEVVGPFNRVSDLEDYCVSRSMELCEFWKPAKGG